MRALDIAAGRSASFCFCCAFLALHGTAFVCITFCIAFARRFGDGNPLFEPGELRGHCSQGSQGSAKGSRRQTRCEGESTRWSLSILPCCATLHSLGTAAVLCAGVGIAQFCRNEFMRRSLVHFLQSSCSDSASPRGAATLRSGEFLGGSQCLEAAHFCVTQRHCWTPGDAPLCGCAVLRRCAI